MQITLQKENLTRARTGNPIIPEKLGEQRIEQSCVLLSQNNAIRGFVWRPKW
jgi:hypothetical protein